MDALGDRMKDYENRFRYYLPRRAYTLLRLDGKAFHTFTKGFQRPFDSELVKAMDNTAKYLCENIQGVKLAYVQSDEITLLLTDFEKVRSCSYFDGNIQKITSIPASMAGVVFNDQIRKYKDGITKPAFFDCRCWSLSDPNEVENTFIWRQQDATRNSIQLVAQSLYSHKQLMHKNTNQLQELIFQKGKNWNDYDDGYKRGRVILKRYYEKEVTLPSGEEKKALRSEWIIEAPPIFTQDREYLRKLIPKIPSWDGVI
jgi:tRNA(His) 5'-end guanylyltransferase